MKVADKIGVKNLLPNSGGCTTHYQDGGINVKQILIIPNCTKQIKKITFVNYKKKDQESLNHRTFLVLFYRKFYSARAPPTVMWIIEFHITEVQCMDSSRSEERR